MSNYCVTIGEREYQVVITEAGLFMDGEPVPCDLVSLNGNGLHQLRRENRSVELYLSAHSRSHYEVLVGGRRVVARVSSADRPAGASAQQAEAGDVTAPMPGLIVDVTVREGDAVEEGQILVVQEAMKMQMPARAPFAGRVERVAVEVGTQVEKDALLVRVVE